MRSADTGTSCTRILHTGTSLRIELVDILVDSVPSAPSFVLAAMTRGEMVLVLVDVRHFISQGTGGGKLTQL